MTTATTQAMTKIQGLSSAHLIDSYREMVRARKIDEKNIVLYKQNKCHFQIGVAGHEAIQLAAASNLKAGYDWFYPYYRDIALVSALGMTNREFMLNAMNKASDPNSGGKQMPMHYGHSDLRIVSQSSPTGSQYLQAVGAAMAAKYRDTDEVVYVSSGEGATSQGDYHEALNWAALQKLPLVFCIQDNKYAISVHSSEQTAGESVASISSGYQNLEVMEVNGLDYIASHKVFKQAVNRARKAQGPTVIVAQVVRLQSHSISDNQEKYRSAKSIKQDKEKDPIDQLGNLLISKKIIASNKDLKAIASEIQTEIDDAAEWAEKQANPLPEAYADNVYVKSHIAKNEVETKEFTPSGPKVFIVDAINHALDEELKRSPEMLIFGQDIAGGKGGVFTVTKDLTSKHGNKRVFNSPLAEASIVGAAIGLATCGLKPVVEIQFGDYVWTGMMQIRNELSMLNYRSNGKFTCPAVIRIPIGGYIHGALYHSQNIEATLSHFPGLHILLPSNATDAKGLLKSAIRSENPVIFLEHKGLYRQVFAKGAEGGPDDLTPIGRAKIVRKGSDVSVITWGALVNKSLVAAEELSKEGINTEVIDIRSIVPLDSETILESVKKTGRILIAHEDVLFMGFGAEIAALIADEAFEYLDAPVKRLAGKNTPIPHAPALENAVLPQNEDVIRALREVLSY